MFSLIGQCYQVTSFKKQALLIILSPVWCTLKGLVEHLLKTTGGNMYRLSGEISSYSRTWLLAEGISLGRLYTLQ